MSDSDHALELAGYAMVAVAILGIASLTGFAIGTVWMTRAAVTGMRALWLYASAVTASGDVIIDPAYEQQHCDIIVRGERVHEEAHRLFFNLHTFFDGVPTLLASDAAMRKINVEYLARSEIDARDKQEAFLAKELAALLVAQPCKATGWSGTVTYVVEKQADSTHSLVPRTTEFYDATGGSETFSERTTFTGTTAVIAGASTMTESLDASDTRDFTATGRVAIFSDPFFRRENTFSPEVDVELAPSHFQPERVVGDRPTVALQRLSHLVVIAITRGHDNA